MNGVIYGGNIGLQGLGFYVDSETPYYDSCKVFELEPICADCKYKLKVNITDPDGLTVQIPDPNNGGALTNQLVVTFTNPNNPTCPEYPYVNYYSLSPLTFAINFTKIGTYQVYKELTLDTTGIYIEINNAIANAGLNETYLEQLIDCYISHTDFSQCDVTCEQHCKSSVKAAHPEWLETSEDFLNAVQVCVQTECAEIINSAITDAADTECEVMLDQMMIDVSPGGYEFAQTGSGGIDDGFWTRVSGKLTAYTYPTLPAEPSTADLENENYIILLDNNGLLIRPLPSLSNIQNPVNWQTISANPEQWATQLAKAHREYCHYKTCIGEAPSNAYDAIVTKATSYSNANTLGYLDPMGLNRLGTIAPLPSGVTVSYVSSGMDPMFATQDVTGGTPYKRMWDILRKAFPHGSYTDIWHYVNDSTSPPYNTTTGASLAFTDANKWLVFRGLYLDKKLALKDSIDEENDIIKICDYFTDEYANVFPSTSLDPNSATVNAI
ncbi:MAG: hypothetical protein L6Q66_14145, partial [Bacteroidia bacterium]|nr:hypothetical protein [Bacteroidia bacterium]